LLDSLNQGKHTIHARVNTGQSSTVGIDWQAAAWSNGGAYRACCIFSFRNFVAYAIFLQRAKLIFAQFACTGSNLWTVRERE